MKTHDLSNKQNYPITHKWVVNSSYINIMSNVYISKLDTLLYNGVKYKVVKDIPNRDERMFDNPTPEIIHANKNVKETSLFYSLVIEKV